MTEGSVNLCPVCGQALIDTNDTCPACRADAGRPQAGEGHASLSWQIDISLLRNKLILQQLALALGIPILFLFGFIVVLEWPIGPGNWRQIAGIPLMVGGILLVLLLIAIGLVYGGRYEYQYRLDAQGISGGPRGGTARKNAVINWLLILSGRPGSMGTGILAATRQAEHVQWKDVNDITAEPQRKTIVLRTARRPHMVVFCDDEHYEKAVQFSREAVMRAHTTRITGA